MKPKITVVTACYRAGEYLKDTVASMNSQSFQDWEQLLVDDGSPDDTYRRALELAEGDERVRVVQKTNGGVSSARNFGFQQAAESSEAVCFLDQDDLYLPDALESLYACLATHKEAVGAHGLAELMDSQGNLLSGAGFVEFGKRRLGVKDRQVIIWPLESPTTFDVLATSFTQYPPSVALLRKSAFNDVGMFDPFYTWGGEDWDLFVRLSRLGGFTFLPKVVVHYRRHENNGTNDIRRMHKMANLVRYKTFFSDLNTSEQRKICRDAFKAMQRYKMGEKRAELETTGRSAKAKLKYTAQMAALYVRYFRGYPTKSGF